MASSSWRLSLELLLLLVSLSAVLFRLLHSIPTSSTAPFFVTGFGPHHHARRPFSFETRHYPHPSRFLVATMSTATMDAANTEIGIPTATADTGTSASLSVSLLQKRLMDLGVLETDISLGHYDMSSSNSDGDITKDVKTLVWEVRWMSSSNNVDYIVTAIPLQDQVDIPLLADLIQKHLPRLKQKQRQEFPAAGTIKTLQLAPQEIAEARTGFLSGCMPPMGHSILSPLFLDTSLIKDNNNSAQVIASIGSGIPGTSLLLPMGELLKVASQTGGVYTGAFIKSKQNSRRSRDDKDADSVTAPSTASTSSEETSPQKRRLQRKQERVERQPKPKDRLQEYRRFQTFDEKSKLLQTTARKKGRYEDVQALVEEAVKQGDFPHLLSTQPDNGNQGKNALHLAAWRGDFETVQLLVETAQRECPEMDVVNMISRGPGNYGKTPIFYALTQCREDVVRYLVQKAGANLLFVNNKGQTPCSISVSHLNETACQLLYNTEAQQLRNGGVFADYRQSHSDEKFYGDLDPRFPIDNFNYGEDLKEQLDQFQASVAASDPSTIIRMDDGEGIPTHFTPRSIRPTVRWWNREEGAVLTNRDEGPPYTFTQAREGKLGGSTHSKEKSASTAETVQRRRSKSPQRDELPRVETIQSLERLNIESVLEGSNAEQSVVLVNCSESIRQLSEEIDTTLGSYAKAHGAPDKNDISSDAMLVDCAWGLDCEWKPGFNRGKDNPVALLQLSTRRKSFLVDLQCLCQATHATNVGGAVTNVEPTSVEHELNDALSKLFEHPGLPLVGFGVLQDLGKLAASFPHLSCFSTYGSVIDLQSVANVLYPKNGRHMLSSLQKMVACLLTKRLDKTEQCSDWTRRPLSQSQIRYATLDAAVLPLLLKTIVQKSVTVQRYSGQFFAVHCKLRTNLRYIYLDDDAVDHRSPEAKKNGEESAWNVPMGRVHRAFSSRQIARQSWPSGQATPPLPKRVAGIDTNDKSRVTKKEKAHLNKVGGEKGAKKPKPLQLRTIAGNLDNLPIPGITLGYTKDSCVSRVVGHEFMNTLPEGTHIGFNRRSGVVETKNAWIIFCSFGGNKPKDHMRGSTFSDCGQHLIFNLNPTRENGRSSETTLTNYILKSSSKEQLSSSSNNNKSKADEVPEYKKNILLFARDGTASQYMYCGRCRCSEYTMNRKSSCDLKLELLDHDQLVGESKISNTFVELVGRRQQEANSP